MKTQYVIYHVMMVPMKMQKMIIMRKKMQKRKVDCGIRLFHPHQDLQKTQKNDNHQQKMYYVIKKSLLVWTKAYILCRVSTDITNI